jgi:hypothetical protein
MALFAYFLLLDNEKQSRQNTVTYILGISEVQLIHSKSSTLTISMVDSMKTLKSY